MKLTKKRYLIGFMGIVAVLAVVRAEFPQLAEPRIAESHVEVNADSVAAAMPHTDFSATATAKKHKIYSVPSFKACFPDTQSVQLAAAMKWGVKRVKNREDAEKAVAVLKENGQKAFIIGRIEAGENENPEVTL